MVKPRPFLHNKWKITQNGDWQMMNYTNDKWLKITNGSEWNYRWFEITND